MFSSALHTNSAFLFLSLFLIAVFASTFGSMVGLGGGFLMVPLLRIVYGMEPSIAAGTSLVLVVANSFSGSLAYFRQRRVNVRTSLLIAAGGFPASIAGAILVSHISGLFFDIAYAVFLIVVGYDVIVNRRHRLAARETAAAAAGIPAWRAIAIGCIVGLVSSLFGIGGGVVVVPALLYFSTLPPHAISATSHFAILLTSPVGVASHALLHDIKLAYAVPLVAGGLTGGQIGAALAHRISSSTLMKLLGAALAIAAASLVLKHVL